MKPGDMAKVRPHDEDDPLANEKSGHRCQVVRFSRSFAGLDYVAVRFSTKGHSVWFRVADLELEKQKGESK